MTAADRLLSTDLRSALLTAGIEIEHRGLQPATLQHVLSLLDGLPPADAARADAQIAYAARLYRPRPSVWGTFGLIGTRWVPGVPGAEHLLLFHRRGHAREEALERLTGGLRSPFFVVAVACRLNDWVPQVRRAARRCAERTFPLTEPAFLAEASIALVDRRQSWRRWSDEAAVLDAMMARADVATH